LMDVLELLRKGNYRMKLVALEGVPDDAAQPAASQSSKP
jgi:biopolymer transport protein ExbD